MERAEILRDEGCGGDRRTCVSAEEPTGEQGEVGAPQRLRCEPIGGELKRA